MQPFDASDYRRRILASVHARGSADDSDPFEIYDIQLDDVDHLSDAQVAARIHEVWAFWQKSRDHPRYRGVVLSLLAVHQQAAAVLATRASRIELRDRVRAGRDARDGERFAEVDAAANRLVQRFGGLPEDKLAGLKALAAARGVDDAAFELRIRRFRRLPAGASERSPRRAVPADVLRQIRADLDELGRITGSPAPRSLFALLGVDPGMPAARIRVVRDELAARNRQRRPDRRRALVDDLLAAVTSLLVEGDPEAYLDALAAAVTEALRPKVATAVLVEDELTVGDAVVLVAEAEGEGLDPARARAVVAALAQEHGVAAPTVAAPTVAAPTVASPGAGHGASRGTGAGSASPQDPPTVPTSRGGAPPEPSAPSRREPSHGAPSWGAPSWGAASRGAPPRGAPPRGTPSRRAPQAPSRPVSAADWQAALSRARAALRAGRPVEARDEMRRAREIAGETLPPIRAVDDDVERALQAAGAAWKAVVGLVHARQFAEAAAGVEELARTASDVPGPDGRTVADVLRQCREQLARADELVARAATAGSAERDDLLAQALELVVDHPGATQALRQVGVDPPTALYVQRVMGSVQVSWQASVTGGDVRYRVRRVLPDGTSRAVGVTTSLSLEDGGAPSQGPIPTYEVTAGRSGVWSTPARWSPADPADGTPSVDAPSVDAPSVETSSVETPDLTRVVPRSAADELAPASGLHVTGDRLRWSWPEGCTEMVVVWRSDGPPLSTDDPSAQARKVTNTRYEIDGGVSVPGVRPLHVAVFGCLRVDGRLVVANVSTPSARLFLEPG